MAVKIVEHLWFTREKWATGFEGISEVMDMWKQVMPVANQYLETLTEPDLLTHLKFPNGANFWDDIGTTILRHTWHYWYHLGESQAIRSGMGHKNLPPFIGNMAGYGQYSA